MTAESEQKLKPIPFYTRVGSVVSLILMAVLIAMMLRNCVNSVEYGSRTGKSAADSSYQLGIHDGLDDRTFSLSAEARENPVLRKSYTKGYRDGVDQRGAGR
jgi:hypothetical protein